MDGEVPGALSFMQLWRRLTPLYDEGEARAVVRTVMEERFGITLPELLCNGTAALSAEERSFLEGLMQRLESSEPVQYVLGAVEFMGHRMSVERGVLIPRPETEALCRWVMESSLPPCPRVLDIGCGSGCIAVSLALGLSGAQVSAIDLSPKALEVTRRNAAANGAVVSADRRDALALQGDAGCWDVIVSNPPYICRAEAGAMHANVKQYEPHEALFVPDDDPLCFYTAIARYAATALSPGGMLFFECNAQYTGSVADMLRDRGFTAVATREDPFGVCRLVKGERGNCDASVADTNSRCVE